MNDTIEDRCARHQRASYEALARHDLKEYFWRVSLAVIEASYGIGQMEARFESMQKLTEATGIHKKHLRKTINDMRHAGMLSEREGEAGGVWVLEFQPNAAADWKVPLRWSPEESRGTRRAMAEVREFSALDPRQLVMEEVTRDGADFDRALREVKREEVGKAEGGRRKAEEDGSHGDVTGGGIAVTPPCDRDGLQSNRDGSHGGVTGPLRALKGCTVKELNSSIAPTAVPCGVTRRCDPGVSREELGAEGAAVADPEAGEELRRKIAESLGEHAASARVTFSDPSRGAQDDGVGTAAPAAAPMDADLRLLLERMWRVIPDQRAGRFAGGWVNRCKACPRAMRYAVDKFLETPPKVRTQNWQWLRAEYIAAARRMGLSPALSGEDRERRGWWSVVAGAVKSLMFGGTLS